MRLLTALCLHGLLVATVEAASFGQCLNNIFFGMDNDHNGFMAPQRYGLSKFANLRFQELVPRADVDDGDALETVIAAGSGMINLSSLLAGGAGGNNGGGGSASSAHSTSTATSAKPSQTTATTTKSKESSKTTSSASAASTNTTEQPDASQIGINWSASASTEPNTRYTCTSQFIDFSDPDSMKYFNYEWCPQNAYQTGDTVTWRLTQECGTTMVYPWDFHYGRIEGQIRIGAGSGVVTTMLLMGPAPADEIDFEWVGKNVHNVQTTFYVQSQRVVPMSEAFEVTGGSSSDLSKSFHNYTIELTKDRVSWYIDGKLCRYRDKSTGLFPSEANRMRMGIWDGTQTSGWAGPIDWNGAPFTAEIRSFNFTPYC
ncbi:transglycosylase [Linderina macrospora]|uniref:Transglycosylase n=1 Tax=Linderina macrospora TaxID=4868 RepID=A0ACC1JEL1_9FUNG|nr:transglycosylase [Linderina macrospora]